MDFIKEEQEHAVQHSDLAATVFLSAAGALKEPEKLPRLAEALKGRNYPSLKLETRVFEDDTRFTEPFAMISIGLRVVHTWSEPWLKSR